MTLESIEQKCENAKNGKNSSHQHQKLVLRDLQSLLRKSINKNMIVVDFNISTLLPKGENYGSTVMKVEVVIRRSKDSPDEKLSLVAKMNSTSDFTKENINNTVSFSKEIFVFEKLIPAYRQLQNDFGVFEKDMLNILPKYYGGRLSMNKAAPDVADDDVVMLMENLKVRGYYTCNRLYGMDYEHAEKAIIELAKFHALGITVKVKNPQLFHEAEKCLNAKFNRKAMEPGDVVDNLVKIISKNSKVAKYRNQVKSNMEEFNWNSWLGSTERVEPWVSITHGDFWVNNILFHQANAKVDDVKFIDFQLTKIDSPLKDLPYFLCCSVKQDVMENHFEDLLDTYYSKLIQTLQETGQDVSAFSRKSFDDKLREDGRRELFQCLLAIKFFTDNGKDVADSEDSTSSIMMSDSNELYDKRSAAIILKFIEKGWL